AALAAAHRAAAEALSALAVAVPITVAALAATAEAARTSVVLADRELGCLPFDFHPFGTRELRAYQRTVHRTFVWRQQVDLAVVVFDIVRRDRRIRRHGRRVVFIGAVCHHDLVGRGDAHDRFFDPREDFLVEHTGGVGLLSAWRLAALVNVLGIARRASRLLDVFVDHRDDGVVRDAPLARAVVVENVTETQPALLHVLTSPELSRKDVRFGMTRVAGAYSLAERLPQAQPLSPQHLLFLTFAVDPLQRALQRRVVPREQRLARQ